MFYYKKILVQTTLVLTLSASALFILSGCDVKEGPLPAETTESTEIVTEQTTELSEAMKALIADAEKTQSWKVFSDDVTGLYGFKDAEGKVVIDAIYKDAQDFAGGRAIVKVNTDDFYGILEEGVYGLIDPNGEFIIEPTGLLTRVDDWHYLFAEGADYYQGYGMDGYSMMKRTFMDGTGAALGDKPLGDQSLENQSERYYYVQALKEDLFLANNGSKSFFIDGKGALLTDYPAFYFAITGEVTGDSIILMPLDESSGRIKFVMSGDGKALEQQNTKETLTEGVTYEHQVISPYIGSSVIFPVLTMNDLTIQSKLNEAIQKFATEAMWETDLTGEKIVDYAQLERIEQTVVSEFTPSLKNKLLNLNLFGYFYGFGAAHPNSFQSTRYLDFTSGDVLELPSLFKSDRDWRMAIAKEIDRQFMADDDAYLFIEKTEPEADRVQAFYDAHFEIAFEENHMVVYFPVYEIAPYVAGIPSYEVSYEVLDKYYDEGSKFYKALFSK